MRVKLSKQPPPASTASAVGPCTAAIQIVGRTGTGSLPSTIALNPAPPPPPHPNYFIAGRSKAAFLFGFFGDFRCGVPLFIVILVVYKNKNR